MMKNYFLAMDIGGTKTSGALFNKSGVLIDDYVFVAPSKTFQGEEAVYQNTKSVLDHIIQHFNLDLNEVEAISVGSPGPLDSQKGIIIHAPLMNWHNFPIVSRLKEDFHKEVYLDNDGNLGALAEQRFGVAKDLKNVIYMTVSTGCGGGLVINSNIYHGKHDGAGEVGHVSIDMQGLPCPCGSDGCFEMYASGTAMNRIMIEDMKQGKKSLVFDLAENKEENINGKLLDMAAKANDEYALEIFKNEGFYLGFGIANLFNVLDPDCIVLGGGVTKSKKYFHSYLMETLKKYCIHSVEEDSVRYSLLNDKVVLYGTYYNALSCISSQ